MKNKIHLIITIFGFICLIPVLIIVPSINIDANNIRYVGGTGNGNFTSIQEGIDIASEGDIVYVYSGIYYENIVINKSLSLIGENIENTIIDGDENGDVIYINSDFINVSGFTLMNSGDNWSDAGIDLRDSTNVKIESINFSHNRFGLFLSQSSSNNTITNNIFYNNTYGTSFQSSSNDNLIENNNYMDNLEAIMVIDSYSNQFFSNNMVNCGMTLGGDFDTYTNQHIPTNNTVNEKSVYYYKNMNMNNASVPIDAGEVILGNVSWLNIRDLNVSYGTVGIDIGFSNQIFISNNVIHSNKQYGIRVFSSNNINISYNVIQQNDLGVSFVYSENNLIYNNTFFKNEDGINIFYLSNGNVIKNNLFSNNTYYAVQIIDSAINEIFNNSFRFNHGTQFPWGSNNTQVMDDTLKNQWNNSEGYGNHWSDWRFPDNNYDGIVDSPYEIYGNDSLDYFPLTESSIPLLSSQPSDFVANSGDQYVNLTWDTPLDDGGSIITNYKISRFRDGFQEIIIESNIFYYNDTNISNGWTYYYKICAINGVGEGQYSYFINATPGTFPQTPKNIRASYGGLYINLTWGVPISNGGFNITNYRIYRGYSNYSSYGLLTFIDEIDTTLFYNDTNISNYGTYFYRISAVSSYGEGPQSDEINVSINIAFLDLDNDGLDDEWEFHHFGDLAQGPNDDYDSDGFSNLQEFNNDTDPIDESDFPQFVDDKSIFPLFNWILILIIIVIVITILIFVYNKKTNK